MAELVCPRCGLQATFVRSRLPGTCMCLVCQSQLDWRMIPGCGPDCQPAMRPDTEPAGRTETGPANPSPAQPRGENDA